MTAEGSAPCILNAANEEAVAAFLDHQIRFTDIARVVAHCLAQNHSNEFHHIDSLLAQDAETRRQAQQFIQRIGR